MAEVHFTMDNYVWEQKNYFVISYEIIEMYRVSNDLYRVAELTLPEEYKCNYDIPEFIDSIDKNITVPEFGSIEQTIDQKIRENMPRYSTCSSIFVLDLDEITEFENDN